MKRFRSHKIVLAAAITEIAPDVDMKNGMLVRLDDGTRQALSPSVIARYTPVVGDYVVQYQDGYLSISPKKAFDEGYVELVDSTSDDRTANNVMRHEYRVLTPSEKADMQHVKDAGLSFYQFIESLGNSRELSLAKTKIEEAVMWAVKHITK